MKKISYTIIVGILALIVFSTTLASTNVASPNSTKPTVYLKPSTIVATAVGQNFTVDIRVDNVTNLQGWTIGLTWNSTALNMTNFSYGPFLGTEWVDFIGLPGEINNTAGEVCPPYGAARPPALLVNGSGILANATFTAKAVGTFDIHLAEIALLSPPGVAIPTNLVDVFTVTWEGNAYPIIIMNNLSAYVDITGGYRLRITNHAFNQSGKKISFNVSSTPGTICAFNVTIPKNLLNDNGTHPWWVWTNGANITSSLPPKVENATHTSLYFTFSSTQKTHKITIEGSWVIPEFPTTLIVPLLVFVTLVAVSLGKMLRPTKRKGSAISNLPQ